MELELQRRAQAKAAALGISFAEYIRRLVAGDLGEQKKSKPDISVLFDLGSSSEPTDIARDKDRMSAKRSGRTICAIPAACRSPKRADRRSAAVERFCRSSVWYAAANIRDRQNRRAKIMLSSVADPLLSDHVLVETWGLLNSRIHRGRPSNSGSGSGTVRAGRKGHRARSRTRVDHRRDIPRSGLFPCRPHQLRRDGALGLTRAASFDDDFAVYRYGRNRDRAFEVSDKGIKAPP